MQLRGVFSSSFIIEVKNCLATAIIPSIGDKKVQMSSDSLIINAGVTSSSSSGNCVLGAYELTQSTSGVTIDSDGLITVDRSQAIAATTLTVSAIVGS